MIPQPAANGLRRADGAWYDTRGTETSPPAWRSSIQVPRNCSRRCADLRAGAEPASAKRAASVHGVRTGVLFPLLEAETCGVSTLIYQQRQAETAE